MCMVFFLTSRTRRIIFSLHSMYMSHRRSLYKQSKSDGQRQTHQNQDFEQTGAFPAKSSAVFNFCIPRWPRLFRPLRLPPTNRQNLLQEEIIEKRKALVYLWILFYPGIWLTRQLYRQEALQKKLSNPVPNRRKMDLDQVLKGASDTSMGYAYPDQHLSVGFTSMNQDGCLLVCTDRCASLQRD